MDIFLARQPIYDDDNKAIAYELLHRSSSENKFDFDVSADEATKKLISNTLCIGFDELVEDKMAYINFSSQLILQEVPSVLPSNKIVIEVLEDVEPTKEVKEAIKKLRNKGYLIALDDVTLKSEFWGFGQLIDIYKIDYRATTTIDRAKIIKGINVFNSSAIFLAEKVENIEEYQEALSLGFKYFQGFYFSKPIMMEGKDIPVRNTNCYLILSELLKKDYDVAKVETIIKADVSISYKIMKMLNSAAFGLVQKVSSIRQAIVLMGKKELSKLLTIIAMSQMKCDNEEEISRLLIIRARFCELVANYIGYDKSEQCFLVGLFSELDKFMQRDMKDIVDELAIEEELKDALLEKDNEIRKVLNLVIAYENMDNFDILKYSLELGIPKGKLVELYMQSINWSSKIASCEQEG